MTQILYQTLVNNVLMFIYLQKIWVLLATATFIKPEVSRTTCSHHTFFFLTACKHYLYKWAITLIYISNTSSSTSDYSHRIALLNITKQQWMLIYISQIPLQKNHSLNVLLVNWPSWLTKWYHILELMSEITLIVVIIQTFFNEKYCKIAGPKMWLKMGKNKREREKLMFTHWIIAVLFNHDSRWEAFIESFNLKCSIPSVKCISLYKMKAVHTNNLAKKKIW